MSTVIVLSERPGTVKSIFDINYSIKDRLPLSLEVPQNSKIILTVFGGS